MLVKKLIFESILQHFGRFSQVLALIIFATSIEMGIVTIIGKIAIWELVRSRPGVVPLGNMLFAWIDDNASSSTDGYF